MLERMLAALMWGIFGLIVGSFLNVVILRHGARSLGGRSSCFSCGKTLSWYELVPVFSWLVQKGRCRGCDARISVQYPLVEATTGIAFALIGVASIGFAQQAVAAILASLLIVIAVYDIEHTIIPDEWVYAFAAVALISSIMFSPELGFASALTIFLSGVVVALPLFLLWFISRGTWMGFGDVKLALGMGWLLGTIQGLQALLLAFVIGAIVSVCILMPLPKILRALRITRLGSRHRALTMKSEVAFGPFLIAATSLVWFLGMYGISIPLI